MRRPTSLPSPAASPPSGRPDRATDAPSRGDTRESLAAGGTVATPEAIQDPGTSPESGTPQAVAAPGDTVAVTQQGAPLPLPDMQQAPDQSTGQASRQVGLRDVWRASRARRKALRAEVRRFTVRQRRRRAIWLGAAASVVLLVLVTLGAAYSPLFGVEKITVVGASQLDAAAVESALSGQLGTPLPLVDESEIKAGLVGFPLVETYALEARPPHELVVRIVERTPIGVISTRAGYTLVDAAGVALATTPDAPSGHAVIDIQGGLDSPAFTAVGRVMRSLPDSIRAQVTAVSASTPDDVTLTLGGTNTQVVWGSAEESAMKARVLETTMTARPPASVSTYDVSSPKAIVVR